MKATGIKVVIAAMLLSAAGLATAESVTNRPNINVLVMGYYIWAKPDYVELCRKEGINIHLAKREDPTGANPANYPLDYLKKFHVIVVSGPMEKAWDPCMVSGGIKPGIVDNLLAYNKLGGGVVWVPLGAGYGALSWTESTGSRIDAVALDESLDGPANRTGVAVTESLRKNLSYYWTTTITKHPVTEGVRGLFMGVVGEWGWPGTIPMKFGKSWKVLVKGMPETRTVTNKTPRGDSARAHTPSGITGTYASQPEIIAVRPSDEGRLGRMMALPIYTTWTWGNFGHIAMKDAFLFNGDGIHPSDGQQFLLNAWRWLAEPAVAAGLGNEPMPENAAVKAIKPPDLSPIVWKPEAAFGNGAPQLRGLFGAHSQYGGGNGTVAEWAAAAKAAQLDYLVFTEDLGKLDETNYAKLVAECQAVSDDTFLAIPGWGSPDINGVYRFFPGISKLPSPSRLSKDGRLAQHVGVTIDSGWTSWPVFAGLEKMTYSPWWEHVVATCAPLVYEGTNLIDNGVDRWYREIESNNMHLLPISLVHVRKPGDLAAVAQNAHVTVLRTDRRADIVPKILRSGFSGAVLPSYVTSGPEILDWRFEMGASEPFRPNSSRFRLVLNIKSAAGLRAVKIIDAADGSTYREWHPNGNTFSVFVDDEKDRQRVFGLIVTDVNGRTAVTAPAYPFMESNRVWFMGDRLMGLHHLTSWNQERTQLVSGQGTALGIGYSKGALGEAAGEFSTSHNDNLKFQGIEGAGVYPPAFKFGTKMRIGGELLFPSYRYHLSLASHDLTVVDFIGDHTLPEPGARFDFNAPPLAFKPTQQADITVRSWLLRQPYMVESWMMLNEVTVTFKQRCKPQSLNFAHYRGADTDTEFNLLCIRSGVSGDTDVRSFAAQEKFSRKTDFTVGGYLYQAKMLAGTMGFVALDDTVYADSQARMHEFNLRPELLREYKPGDVIKTKMLRVSRAFIAEQGSNDWLKKLIRDYGIGTAPGYPYTVLQGAVKEINYIFDLQADKGGAAVAIGKYPLVSSLPLRVNGMRERTCCGEYDLDTKRVRPLPCFEGTVTTCVEPKVKGVRLYLGEWMSWDNPAARISVVTDGTDFLLEAHNPIGAEIVCTLAGAPGFAPLADYKKEFRLAPYSSVKEKIPSAPGSVKLEPMR